MAKQEVKAPAKEVDNELATKRFNPIVDHGLGAVFLLLIARFFWCVNSADPPSDIVFIVGNISISNRLLYRVIGTWEEGLPLLPRPSSRFVLVP